MGNSDTVCFPHIQPSAFTPGPPMHQGKVHLTTLASGAKTAFYIDIIYHVVRQIYGTENQSRLAECEQKYLAA